MNTQDLNRAADAVEQISVDSLAAVVAIKKSNGQIVIFNIGDPTGRKEIYGIIGACPAHSKSSHIILNTFKEKEGGAK